MFCIVSEGVSLAIYPLSHNTPPEAARGKPGAVQTWVLTAHPESAPDGLLKGKIDLFGALRGVPPMRGPPSRDLKGFTRYLRRSRVFVRATEGDFIDICVVRGMFCVVGEGFYALFTSFAGVLKSYIRRFYR